MDALNTLILAEATETSTATWAVLMSVVAFLGTCVHVAFDWLKGRGDRAEARAEARTDESVERTERFARENENLQRQLLLAEIKSIGERMNSAQAEMKAEVKAALAAIQASVTRHDSDIDELHRKLNALMEWKIGVDAGRKALAGPGIAGGDGHG